MERQDRIQRTKFIIQIFAFLFVFLVFQLIGNISLILKGGSMSKSTEWGKNAKNTEASFGELEPEGVKYLIYSDSGSLETETALKDTFTSTGMSYQVYQSPEEFEAAIPESIEAVFVCSSRSSLLARKDILDRLANRGISLIFLQMPEASLIREYDLYSILGVRSEIQPLDQKGMRMVSGFLVGGMQEYKDLTFPMLHVELQASCKTYAYGLTDGKQTSGLKNEQLPPVIWRNSYLGSQIFVVNGPFVNARSGGGMVTAILAQMKEAYLYPVINGVSIVAENFPFIQNENEKELLKQYNYSALGLQQDIILPSLISTSKKYDIKLGCFIKGEEVDLTHNEAYKNLNYFIREIKILDGEIGFHTSENQIPYTVNGVTFTDEERLAFYSDVTAKGLIAQKLDMEQVLYPKSEKDDWIYISRYLDTMIYTFRHEFPHLLVLNPSELLDHIHNYDAVTQKIQYRENEIDVQRSADIGDTYFFLRTDRGVAGIEGGSCKEVEEHVYMVTMGSKKMRITLANE